MPVEVVFLDVGGPIYGDRPFYEALWRAISESRPFASEADFWEEFERARSEQSGPMTRRLISHFVEEEEARDEVLHRARGYWEYPPEVLQPDAAETIAALAQSYRLGVIANQQPWIRETMRRDGLAERFEIWAVSAELGIDKPDPRIFEHALAEAGEPADRCAMVGDRLDNDVRPAKALGMKAVWLLRGEAPDDPTAEQLAVPDATIRTLDELPATLDRL
ncbi:MAG TPA: HAD family hydrolase [Actinomycetota bacterium]|nr:HAD family hydrolase [Actinomycetota bacterium]